MKPKMDYREVKELCYQYNIKKWFYNNWDGSIDVYGDVNLQTFQGRQLPLKFNWVRGNFNIWETRLTTLDGAPCIIDGDFNCYDNELTSLYRGPQAVKGDYNIRGTILKNLEYIAPIIGRDLIFDDSLCSTYSANEDLQVGGVVRFSQYNNTYSMTITHRYNQCCLRPEIVMNLRHIDLILKYQRYFSVWNDDLTFNVENFNELIFEIEDGLL